MMVVGRRDAVCLERIAKVHAHEYKQAHLLAALQGLKLEEGHKVENGCVKESVHYVRLEQPKHSVSSNSNHNISAAIKSQVPHTSMYIHAKSSLYMSSIRVASSPVRQSIATCHRDFAGTVVARLDCSKS